MLDLNELLPHRTHPLVQSVATWLRGAVGIACSGGADSTALLLASVVAAHANMISPIVVFHVDHRTRPDSLREGNVVAALCARLGVPFAPLQVADESETLHESPEERLRRLRYAALADALRVWNLNSIATAHTLDDQVETILARLLSGTGATGAAGMAREITLQTSNGPVSLVRPFLGDRRDACRMLVAGAGIEPFEDPSNEDRRYRRNALRHDILPLMQQHFPGYEAALLRSVGFAAEDSAYLDALARERYEAFTREQAFALPRDWVRDGPTPLVQRVLRLIAMDLIAGDARNLSAERIGAVRRAAGGRTGATIELPYGVRAYIDRETIAFSHVSETCRSE